MQRYLIRHDAGGTWNLVVHGDTWTVEHIRRDLRYAFALKEFAASSEGRRLSQQLSQALMRALKS